MSDAHTPCSVLHITDLHLLSGADQRLIGVDTTASLVAVLNRALSERRPDLLLVTGDIAHEPSESTYRRVRELLESFYDGAMLCLPGNHDVLVPMRAAGLAMDPVELGGWWVTGWDTHEDDRPAALFDESRFQALQDALATVGERHVLIATHHPLVDVGCPWLDKDRLQNAAELLECLSEHSAVKALVFGHAHQTVEAHYRHIQLLGTPSTCFQFEPASLSFGIDDAAPGYRWLNLSSDGALTTEVGRADDFELTIDLARRNP